MRQDIIDVLRTSHMDLVRALIGLPPYAVHRWHMAYHKVVSTFAFKLVSEQSDSPVFSREGPTPIYTYMYMYMHVYIHTVHVHVYTLYM